MKKILILAIGFVLSASMSFSQGLLQLTLPSGDQSFYDISEIGIVKPSGTGSLIIFRSRARGIVFNESPALILSSTCNAFMQITSSGNATLINKGQVRQLARDGAGTRLTMQDGFADIKATESYAVISAQAAVPVGCGGGGGGATNLAYVPAPTNGTVTSSTGASATLTLATGTNAGLMPPAMFNNSHAAVTVTDDATIDFTLTGQALTAVVPDNAITNTKASDMAANTVKVNNTASPGNPVDMAVAASQLVGRGSTGNVAPIVLGTNLSMSGTTLNATGGGTADVKATVNGGRFTYRVLSGTPVLTFDKTNPLAPTLTVAGGTIQLIEVRDEVVTAVSVNPTYTFNATWADALDTAPSDVVKVSVSSGQYNISNTPQTIVSTTGTTQSVVTVNGISSNTRLIINWN